MLPETVYILISIDYHDNNIVGIFTEKSLAEKYKEFGMVIEEMPLNKFVRK